MTSTGDGAWTGRTATLFATVAEQQAAARARKTTRAQRRSATIKTLEENWEGTLLRSPHQNDRCNSLLQHAFPVRGQDFSIGLHSKVEVVGTLVSKFRPQTTTQSADRMRLDPDRLDALSP